jgi:hypothetical protein
MATKETTAGIPMRSVLEQCDADRSLHCHLCGLEIVRIALQEDRLVVASPLRRLRLKAEDLGKAPAALLGVEPARLHAAMMTAHHDGLEFYCPDCDAMYCERHYRCIPQWDEGFYDYTLGICPEGHERIVDD